MKKTRNTRSRSADCSVHPLAVECVRLKAKLGEAGLYKTMQKMEEVVTAVGWELAERAPNAGGEFRRDSDVNSTALLADESMEG